MNSSHSLSGLDKFSTPIFPIPIFDPNIQFRTGIFDPNIQFPTGIHNTGFNGVGGMNQSSNMLNQGLPNGSSGQLSKIDNNNETHSHKNHGIKNTSLAVELCSLLVVLVIGLIVIKKIN